MTGLISTLYVLSVLLGAAFALAEVRMLVRFVRNRDGARAATRSSQAERSAPAPANAPTVTVQLPLFNERVAARQVILAAAGQDYPRDRFDIQVLDDSTDETRDVVAAAVADVKAMGVRIEHIRRENREGFKAGALAAGLQRSAAEFVAVFDADFRPRPDFLRRVIVEHDAFRDPRVSFVQTRWAFDNTGASLFHTAMALLLDRHFYIQKPVRAFAGQVTVFNGSAGVWRRAAIEAAGGWSADTLTEDLDLSFRCALAGWEGRYMHDVAVPNELPEEMRAFKLQQRRWARGNAQCFRKLIGRVIDPGNRLVDRWEEVFLLAGYAIHPVLLVYLVLWPWAVLYLNRPFFIVTQALMSATTFVAPVSFALTLNERGERLRGKHASQLIAAMGIGMGLMVNNTVGQVQGFLLGAGEFARTPKGWTAGAYSAGRAQTAYSSPLHWSFAAEVLVIVYCLLSAVLLLQRGEWFWVFPLLFWGACVALVVKLQVRR